MIVITGNETDEREHRSLRAGPHQHDRFAAGGVQ